MKDRSIFYGDFKLFLIPTSDNQNKLTHFIFKKSLISNPTENSLQRPLSKMNNLFSVNLPMKKFINVLHLLNKLVKCEYLTSGVVAVLRVYVFKCLGIARSPEFKSLRETCTFYLCSILYNF
jgi:hypothetical protein